jgi:hypothetical protein
MDAARLQMAIGNKVQQKRKLQLLSHPTDTGKKILLNTASERRPSESLPNALEFAH